MVFKGFPMPMRMVFKEGEGLDEYLVVDPEVALAQPDVLIFVLGRPAAWQRGLLLIHLQEEEQLEKGAWEQIREPMIKRGGNDSERKMMLTMG